MLYRVIWLDEDDAAEAGREYGAYVTLHDEYFAGPFNSEDEAYDWLSKLIEE